MSQTFESIEIDGAFIKEFAFTPSEEVRVFLLRAPQQDSDEQVTTRSELKFYKANFRAQPWLEIKSHESSNRLNYEEQQGLQELKGQNLSSSEESFRVFRERYLVRFYGCPVWQPLFLQCDLRG